MVMKLAVEPQRWREALPRLSYSKEVIDRWLADGSFISLPSYVQADLLKILPEGKTPWWCRHCPPQVQRCLFERTASVDWERIDMVAEWPIYEKRKSLKNSLLLKGDSGSGKSLSMWALARMIELKTGRPPVWRTGPSLARDVQIAARDLVAPEHLTGCDYLFIDDLGKEKATETVATGLWDLIDTRMAWGRPMVISTRYVGEAFAERISDPVVGHDIVRRLRDVAHAVTFAKAGE